MTDFIILSKNVNFVNNYNFQIICFFDNFLKEIMKIGMVFGDEFLYKSYCNDDILILQYFYDVRWILREKLELPWKFLNQGSDGLECRSINI